MPTKHILLSQDEFKAFGENPVPLEQLKIPEEEKEDLRKEAMKMVGTKPPPAWPPYKLVPMIVCQPPRNGMRLVCRVEWILEGPGGSKAVLTSS
jgi:hypothetical protein